MLNLKQNIILILSSTVVLNASTLSELVITIEGICQAPSDEKSSYYKIVAKGKSNLDVKFIDIDGDVSFTKEEWKGVRDVFKDNQDYRKCSIELSRLLIPRVVLKKEKEKENKNEDNNSSKETHTYNFYGEKSPPIINPQSPTTIIYNENKNE